MVRRPLHLSAHVHLTCLVITLGVTTALFFQSLRTLLYPTRGRVMWGLAAHTVAMFLCLTVSVVIEFVQLVPFEINDREDDDEVPGSYGIWGPWRFTEGSDLRVLQILSPLVFPLNQWLADGLLVFHVSNPILLVVNPGHVSSCIVAISYTLGTTWSSFHA